MSAAALETVQILAPYVTAIVALLGSVYAVGRGNRNQLAAAYFEKMSTAYEQHWESFARFVYDPTDETRDAYTVALYNALLYASDGVAVELQSLYRAAISYTRTGGRDVRELDAQTWVLMDLLQEDMVSFQSRNNRIRRAEKRSIFSALAAVKVRRGARR